MQTFTAVLATATLALTSAAMAQDEAAPAPPPAEDKLESALDDEAAAVEEDGQAEGSDAAEDPGDKIRCKQVKALNSRIPTRVCMTVQEWEERNRATLEEKRRMRNRNSYCSGSGPC